MGTPRGLVERGRDGLHMDGWFRLGGLRVDVRPYAFRLDR